MKGWDRLRQRAVMQPFILIMQITALLIISLAQPHAAGPGGLPLSTLLYIPVSLAGTSAGMALCQRMSDFQFAKAVNILLIVSGLGFVV